MSFVYNPYLPECHLSVSAGLLPSADWRTDMERSSALCIIFIVMAWAASLLPEVWCYIEAPGAQLYSNLILRNDVGPNACKVEKWRTQVACIEFGCINLDFFRNRTNLDRDHIVQSISNWATMFFFLKKKLGHNLCSWQRKRIHVCFMFSYLPFSSELRNNYQLISSLRSPCRDKVHIATTCLVLSLSVFFHRLCCKKGIVSVP